ncbi:MAG TPA: hypothetical protein PK691_04190 [Thermomicrobiales bacterium]|nr:hypothetical protein [Thermomicrobiales bacterium]
MLRSLLDRQLMNLADRGGASGYVGSAWGVQCGTWLVSQIGAPIMWGGEHIGEIVSIIDVDALPGIPAFASSRGLQNPDYLIQIDSDAGMYLVGVDAKFSIETAKPRQVSIAIVTALVETEGSPLAPLIPNYDAIVDGFFLSPDYELTDLVLTGRAGILRATVSPSDLVRIHPNVPSMFARPDLINAMAVLAEKDAIDSSWQDDLVPALYYARVAFACAGCLNEETRPLLGPPELAPASPTALATAIHHHMGNIRSAWELLLSWDREAEVIREIRVRFHGAADIGISNRDLRHQVEEHARKLGITAPSMNRVRRALTEWSRSEITNRIGVIRYPVADVEGDIRRVLGAVSEIRPEVPRVIRQIVADTAAT